MLIRGKNMNIDEATRQGLIPLVEDFPFSLESAEWELLESKNGDIVAGVSVLGYVRGPFFIVEGASQNGRWYSRVLWEKVINENHDAHDQGYIIGTIGHDLELNDKALREGKGSHRVTRLWIPNNEVKDKQCMGMGEAAILDTTTGKELYGYLKGGVNLSVSSRAFGKFEGKKDGVDIVEASTYKYEGFDFVRKGGVEGAIPSLVEEKSKVEEKVTETKAKIVAKSVGHPLPKFEGIKKQKSMGESQMSDEVKSILEKITEEKAKLQTQLDTVLANNEDLKGKLAISDNRLGEVTETLDEYKSLGTVVKIQGQLTDIQKIVEDQSITATTLEETDAKLKIAEAALKAFEELGTAEEIDMAFDVSKNMAKSLKDVGTIREFKAIKESIAVYENLGTIDEFKKVLKFLEDYSKFGTAGEIQEAFEKTKEYVDSVNEIGNVDDIKGKLEEYVELGTPEEISEAFNMTENIIKKTKKEKHESDIKEVQQSLKIKETTARGLLEKMDKSEALSMVSNLRDDFGLEVSERYVVNDNDESLNEELNDEEEVRVPLSVNRAARLTESMGR